MHTSKFNKIMVGIILTVIYLNLYKTAAAQDKVNVIDFIIELMRRESLGNQKQAAVWLPLCYFIEANHAQTGVDRKIIEEAVACLKPYIIIMVFRAHVEQDGGIKYMDEANIRDSAVLKLKDGSEIKSLDQVPTIVQENLYTMKNAMARTSGIHGANMHILLFPEKDSKGESIIDTTKKGKLKLIFKATNGFDEVVFTWYTPFDAMTNPLTCAQCKEKISAKWDFCPWCGNRIVK